MSINSARSKKGALKIVQNLEPLKTIDNSQGTGRRKMLSIASTLSCHDNETQSSSKKSNNAKLPTNNSLFSCNIFPCDWLGNNDKNEIVYYEL